MLAEHAAYNVKCNMHVFTFGSTSVIDLVWKVSIEQVLKTFENQFFSSL